MPHACVIHSVLQAVLPICDRGDPNIKACGSCLRPQDPKRALRITGVGAGDLLKDIRDAIKIAVQESIMSRTWVQPMSELPCVQHSITVRIPQRRRFEQCQGTAIIYGVRSGSAA